MLKVMTCHTKEDNTKHLAKQASTVPIFKTYTVHVCTVARTCTSDTTFDIAAFIAICCVFDIAEESDFNALNRTKEHTSFLMISTHISSPY